MDCEYKSLEMLLSEKIPELWLSFYNGEINKKKVVLFAKVFRNSGYTIQLADNFFSYWQREKDQFPKPSDVWRFSKQNKHKEETGNKVHRCFLKYCDNSQWVEAIEVSEENKPNPVIRLIKCACHPHSNYTYVRTKDEFESHLKSASSLKITDAWKEKISELWRAALV